MKDLRLGIRFNMSLVGIRDDPNIYCWGYDGNNPNYILFQNEKPFKKVSNEVWNHIREKLCEGDLDKAYEEMIYKLSQQDIDLIQVTLKLEKV